MRTIVTAWANRLQCADECRKMKHEGFAVDCGGFELGQNQQCPEWESTDWAQEQ